MLARHNKPSLKLAKWHMLLKTCTAQIRFTKFRRIDHDSIEELFAAGQQADPCALHATQPDLIAHS